MTGSLTMSETASARTLVWSIPYIARLVNTRGTGTSAVAPRGISRAISWARSRPATADRRYLRPWTRRIAGPRWAKTGQTSTVTPSCEMNRRGARARPSAHTSHNPEAGSEQLGQSIHRRYHLPTTRTRTAGRGQRLCPVLPGLEVLHLFGSELFE
jgi:hypothetical protein